jgi:hypothetical protein
MPLLTALAFAQEAPSAKPKTNATQLPVQILPTGEEDAAPSARAQEFSARAVQSDAQALEQQLRQMTSESAEGLTTTRRPDGTIGIDLEGRFQSVSIARLTEDGRYVVSCHTGEDALKHAHHAADIAAGKAPKLKAEAAHPAAPTRPQILEEK